MRFLNSNYVCKQAWSHELLSAKSVSGPKSKVIETGTRELRKLISIRAPLV